MSDPADELQTYFNNNFDDIVKDIGYEGDEEDDFTNSMEAVCGNKKYSLYPDGLKDKFLEFKTKLDENVDDFADDHEIGKTFVDYMIALKDWETTEIAGGLKELLEENDDDIYEGLGIDGDSEEKKNQ